MIFAYDTVVKWYIAPDDNDAAEYEGWRGKVVKPTEAEFEHYDGSKVGQILVEDVVSTDNPPSDPPDRFWVDPEELVLA